ncbi:hypothetical protein ACIQ1D_18950 [Lysinibacillus xylanilyticus]|uniref:hypothetical protein n=1 Tax=Lysinibacillus xylanilyticus TaxID=582475 RepID=UPI0037F76A86
MKITANENTEIFEINYKTEGLYLVDSSCGVHATEKTEFIDTLKEWSKIVPHLEKEDVINSIIYGFELFDNKEAIELVKQGLYEPSFYNHCSIECSEDLSTTQFNWLKKHDPNSIARFREWEDLVDLHYEDIENNPFPDFHWIEPKSWFSFMPAHRCFHMSYFEKEFGKILYPELDWKIVHAEKHAFAVGLSTDGNFHIDKIFDMSWWWENDNNTAEETKEYLASAGF